MRLSISRVGTLSRCGMQYHYRYNEGIIAPPGVAAIVGKGTHQANASDLLAKMDGGSLLSTEEVQDIAAQATTKEWESAPVALDEEEKAEGSDKVKGQAIDRAVGLATLYHLEVAPSIAPVAIEQQFLIALPTGDELTGYKDIETTTHVRDTKTSGKSPDANAAHVSLQLTAYLMESSMRGEPKAGILDYLVSTKKPKVVTQETTRGKADFDSLVSRLDIAGQTIRAGVFAPCPPDSWCCSPKWCGYWELCPFGAKGRTKKEGK